MIARRLLDELQQLSREEKIHVVQFLNNELSDDTAEPFKGGSTAMLPLVRAPRSAISIIEQLEREAQTDG